MLVFLVIQLVAGENNFLCIDYDNEISAINVGRIVSLVLSAQYGSDLAADSAHSLIGPVHNVPFALYGSCICMLCGEV
jgi:NhaP-type Na+/H+ and K+/H+ antiporter